MSILMQYGLNVKERAGRFFWDKVNPRQADPAPIVPVGEDIPLGGRDVREVNEEDLERQPQEVMPEAITDADLHEEFSVDMAIGDLRTACKRRGIGLRSTDNRKIMLVKLNEWKKVKQMESGTVSAGILSTGVTQGGTNPFTAGQQSGQKV